MQSELTGFTDTSTGSKPSAAQPAADDLQPLFTGEIDAALFEEITRHVTGYFEYLLMIVTADGLTLKPYITKNDQDMFSQAVTIPVDEWESYDLAHDKRYIGAVEPYAGLYQAFTGRELPETITVELSPQPDTPEKWETLRDHDLYEPNADDGNDADPTLDTVSIADHETPVLRNPARDVLTVNELSYHTSTLIESTYDVKQWLAGRGDETDDRVILIAASTGTRQRDHEYVLSFTEVDADDWEVTDDSLLLTGDSVSLSGDDPDLSDVTVGGTQARPKAIVEQCLPEAHRNATQITWGFYRPAPLAGMFKHVLKDSLTEGTFRFKMSSDFPLQLTHEVSTALEETDSDVTIQNMLAPVVSPT